MIHVPLLARENHLTRMPLLRPTEKNVIIRIVAHKATIQKDVRPALMKAVVQHALRVIPVDQKID